MPVWLLFGIKKRLFTVKIYTVEGQSIHAARGRDAKFYSLQNNSVK